MRSKCIIPLLICIIFTLTGCTWRELIYQPNAQTPQTVTIKDDDYSYYEKTETTGYGWDNNPFTVTKETLFGCPSEPNETYGCFAIHRDGESGQLDGNYKEEWKNWQTDMCFAIFTDQDTGEVYYQLYRSSSTDIVLDANETYIVVPQAVFDKLLKQHGYIRKPEYTQIHY